MIVPSEIRRRIVRVQVSAYSAACAILANRRWAVAGLRIGRLLRESASASTLAGVLRDPAPALPMKLTGAEVRPVPERPVPATLAQARRLGGTQRADGRPRGTTNVGTSPSFLDRRRRFHRSAVRIVRRPCSRQTAPNMESRRSRRASVLDALPGASTIISTKYVAFLPGSFGTVRNTQASAVEQWHLARRSSFNPSLLAMSGLVPLSTASPSLPSLVIDRPGYRLNRSISTDCDSSASLSAVLPLSGAVGSAHHASH